MGVVARMVSPMIMQEIGFYKTYLGLLILECTLAFTITTVAPYPRLYQIWAVVSLATQGSTMSIFTPFSG